MRLHWRVRLNSTLSLSDCHPDSHGALTTAERLCFRTVLPRTCDRVFFQFEYAAVTLLLCSKSPRLLAEQFFEFATRSWTRLCLTQCRHTHKLTYTQTHSRSVRVANSSHNRKHRWHPLCPWQLLLQLGQEMIQRAASQYGAR